MNFVFLNDFMISVQRALKLIVANTTVLDSEFVDIGDSVGSILSDNILAPISLPPFDQSAMDGYAIQFSDYIFKKKIEVIGEVAAGDLFHGKIISGQAIRIFTGAPIPDGADTVVMQEKIAIEKGNLIIKDFALKRGNNIRKTGSQIKKDKIAFSKGMIITPGGVGYMAGLGISSVNVISKPRITIVVTGSELRRPGEALSKGKIYESNSCALSAALYSMGLKAGNIIFVNDDKIKTFNALKKAVKNSDMVVLTGGVSVGEYDFVGKAISQLRAENIFYKIKQKPGKPLFFAKYNKTLIFGMPGNPAATLSCFYEYVYPAIRIMCGHKDIYLKKVLLPIAEHYSKKKGLSFFLKAKILDNTVIPLEGQESYILSSFALADSLIYLPEESESIKKGEIVEVHKLPCL